MKRVKQLAALVMAAVMVLCTGCGSEPEVAKGLEIRAAFLEEPSTLDPAYAVSDVERTSLTNHKAVFRTDISARQRLPCVSESVSEI